MPMQPCRICGQLFSNVPIDKGSDYSLLDDHEHESHAIYMLNSFGDQLVFGITEMNLFAFGRRELILSWAGRLAHARRELERYFPSKRFEMQYYVRDLELNISRYYIAYEV